MLCSPIGLYQGDFDLIEKEYLTGTKASEGRSIVRNAKFTSVLHRRQAFPLDKAHSRRNACFDGLRLANRVMFSFRNQCKSYSGCCRDMGDFRARQQPGWGSETHGRVLHWKVELFPSINTKSAVFFTKTQHWFSRQQKYDCCTDRSISETSKRCSSKETPSQFPDNVRKTGNENRLVLFCCGKLPWCRKFIISALIITSLGAAVQRTDLGHVSSASSCSPPTSQQLHCMPPLFLAQHKFFFPLRLPAHVVCM